MFNQSIDDRLSSWSSHRAMLDQSSQPLVDVWEFWQHAPYIPYNKKVDPYYQQSWPSPWEIIVENKYDDFTKAVMIAWTLKLTKRFRYNKIEIKTYVDRAKNSAYNIVCVDDEWLINYKDNGPVSAKDLPDSFFLENVIELKIPR